MEHIDFEDSLELASLDVSRLLGEAVRISQKNFRSDVSDDPILIVSIAQLLASVAIRRSIDGVESELSSIENAIAGK